MQTVLPTGEFSFICVACYTDTSNASELWFDTSSGDEVLLTVKFRDASRYVVCADMWTEQPSDLACIHTGCKYEFALFCIILCHHI